jgi:hypothetical protein
LKKTPLIFYRAKVIAAVVAAMVSNVALATIKGFYGRIETRLKPTSSTPLLAPASG